MNEFNLNNSACEKCGLCKTRKQVVNGTGPLNAKIMIVGEAPGSTENTTGCPFTGDSGKYLDKMLAKAGLSRTDIRTTNVVRCLPAAPPPEYVRAPTWEEMQTCLPYLEQEIAAIKPNVIVPVGNIALRAVLGTKKANITDHRGTEMWSEKYGCKIMPTFHPSAVMRNPKYEDTVVQDFARIKASAEYPALTETKVGSYLVIDTIELFDEFIERIKQVETFVFDIETSGLNWQKDKIMCISFSWKEKTACLVPLLKYIGREEEHTEIKKRRTRKTKNGQTLILDKEVPVVVKRIVDDYEDFWKDKQAYVLSKLKEVFESNVGKAAQNAKFDCKFLMKSFGWQVNNLVFDTLLAHHLLNENIEHGLDDLTITYTDMGAYWTPLENWFKASKIASEKRNYARVPTEILWPYAMSDADATYRLMVKFQDLLAKDSLEDLFYRLVMPLNNNLLQVEYEGMKIDRDSLNQAKEELEKEISDLSIEIKAETGEIDLDSPQQLSELFFQKLKLPITKTTPKGAPSTDEEALNNLAGYHSVPKKILAYRGVQKLYNTYVCGIEELLDENDRVHTNFLLHGTVTGRLSSRNPNLQNIPADDKRIKNMFVVEPDYVLVESDMGQIEFRWWAQYSQDPQMLADLRAGLDIHRVTAASALDIPPEQVTDKQRTAAKRIVFGLLFGMGAAKLARQNDCSESHAKKVIRQFFYKYPVAQSWLEQIVSEARRTGQVRSFFGRIRRLPGINHPDDEIRSEAERQAKNSPIQGAASDMTCNAANRIVLRFLADGIRGKLRLLVHDAIYTEVHKDDLVKAIKIIKEEMEKPIKGFNVPLIAEVKTGTRWGQMQKWSNGNGH